MQAPAKRDRHMSSHKEMDLAGVVANLRRAQAADLCCEAVSAEATAGLQRMQELRMLQGRSQLSAADRTRHSNLKVWPHC